MKTNYTSNTPITIESLSMLAEQLEKYKITVTASYMIKEDEIIIIDHEKMRDDNHLNYFIDKKRGKEILCNPKYEELIRKELHEQ